MTGKKCRRIEEKKYGNEMKMKMKKDSVYSVLIARLVC